MDERQPMTEEEREEQVDQLIAAFENKCDELNIKCCTCIIVPNVNDKGDSRICSFSNQIDGATDIAMWLHYISKGLQLMYRQNNEEHVCEP